MNGQMCRNRCNGHNVSLLEVMWQSRHLQQGHFDSRNKARIKMPHIYAHLSIGLRYLFLLSSGLAYRSLVPFCLWCASALFYCHWGRFSVSRLPPRGSWLAAGQTEGVRTQRIVSCATDNPSGASRQLPLHRGA